MLMQYQNLGLCLWLGIGLSMGFSLVLTIGLCLGVEKYENKTKNKYFFRI